MPKLSPESKAKLSNFEWLFTEYWVNDRLPEDIGKELGCTQVNVMYYMKKLGIESMTVRQRKQIEKNKEKYR